jgi:hypothetical protein
MTRAATILGIFAIGLMLLLISFAVARREYAKELLVNSQATIAWKESDSVTSAVVTSFVLSDFRSGDKTSAVNRLCESLALDVETIEGFAAVSQINSERRLSALKHAKQALRDSCGHK